MLRYVSNINAYLCLFLKCTLQQQSLLKCPSTLLCIHPMEYYTTIQMTSLNQIQHRWLILINIVWSKRSQVRRIPDLIYRKLKTHKNVSVQEARKLLMFCSAVTRRVSERSFSEPGNVVCLNMSADYICVFSL